MNVENRELLEEVINKNLAYSLEADSDEKIKESFDMAMKAIDRDISICKNDDTYQEHVDELNIRKEEIQKDALFKDKEFKMNCLRWSIEFIAALVVAPMIDKKIKEGFAKMVMVWEESNTFTTTPGKKIIGDIFRFKK